MNAVTDHSKLAGQLAPPMRARRSAREREVATASLGRRADLLPDLRIAHYPLAELKAAKRKVRKVDGAHVAELARAIAALGFTVPLLVEQDGTIIDGHIRLEAARALALKMLPCVIVDHLDEPELTALKIAVNRLGEKGGWDVDALRLDFELLIETDVEIDLTGFSMPEIDIVLSLDDKADAPEPEELAPDPGPPVSRLGDVWQLGPHRLFVGDSTCAESYNALMKGNTAACVFTDPPYNIPIAGFVSLKGKHGDFAMGVGEMTDDAFRGFLAKVLGHATAVLDAGGVMFGCMDWRNLHLLTVAGADVGLTHVNTAVWNKGVGGMGGLYRSAHEMVAVFAKGRSPGINNVALGKHGRDRTNVWNYPGANRRGSSANNLLADHPTPKPVELVRDALLDVTRRGDIVLDPFLGSGTTIMAAQACGRVGFGIELDPTYADLIVRRWQAATGQCAELAQTSETFDQVKIGRAKG